MEDKLENRVVILETLMNAYVKDIEALLDGMEKIQQNIEELKIAVKQRETVNGYVQNEIKELGQQVKEVREDNEVLKRFMWTIVGGLFVVEFIFKFLLR